MWENHPDQFIAHWLTLYSYCPRLWTLCSFRYWGCSDENSKSLSSWNLYSSQERHNKHTNEFINKQMRSFQMIVDAMQKKRWLSVVMTLVRGMGQASDLWYKTRTMREPAMQRCGERILQAKRVTSAKDLRWEQVCMLRVQGEVLCGLTTEMSQVESQEDERQPESRSLGVISCASLFCGDLENVT